MLSIQTFFNKSLRLTSYKSACATVISGHGHIEIAVLAVRISHVRTSTRRSLLSAIWVLVAQWLDLASQWRSEGCWFDSRLRLRNIFLSLRPILSSKQFTKVIYYFNAAHYLYLIEKMNHYVETTNMAAIFL